MENFKKYLPIILPTNEEGIGLLFHSFNHHQTGIVNYTKDEQIKLVHRVVYCDGFSALEEIGEYRHIYIVDSKKLGYDAHLTNSEKLEIIDFTKKNYHYIKSSYGLHSIVATTDKSLGLPLISGTDALKICNNKIDEFFLETEKVGFTLDGEITFDPLKIEYKKDVVKLKDGVVTMKFTKLYTTSEMKDEFKILIKDFVSEYGIKGWLAFEKYLEEKL